MPDDDGHIPDLDELDDEQKVELIEDLHEMVHNVIDQHNAHVETISSLAWALRAIGEQLAVGNKGLFVNRRKEINIAVEKLNSLSTMAYITVGVTPAALAEHDQYWGIVADLNDDPEFTERIEDAEHGDSDAA